METPDKWIIIKITKDDTTIYKVLAGWSGGYLDGQSWRLNSGIVKVETQENHYLFHGHSGSVYKCSKKGYGTNNIMNSIVTDLLNNKNVEILGNRDFSKLLGE
jgi:Mor family transcriptional regulator